MIHSSEKKRYRSANHKHLLELHDQEETDWLCDGERMLGYCKSNKYDEFNVCRTRYTCKKCKNFNLCESCLRAPTNRQLFYSKNHRHPFFKTKSENGWLCNGLFFFGRCKSNLNDFNQSDRTDHYQCSKCDWDLCEKCFNEPEIEKFAYNNHPHLFKPWSKGPCSAQLYGKCQQNNLFSAEHSYFKCVKHVKCPKLIICKSCFEGNIISNAFIVNNI